jgi:hypothetical protein
MVWYTQSTPSPIAHAVERETKTPVLSVVERETKTPIARVDERGTKTPVTRTVKEDTRTSDQHSADADAQPPISPDNLRRLRRVPGKIPYAAYAVTVGALAQILSLSGTLVVSALSGYLYSHCCSELIRINESPR